MRSFPSARGRRVKVACALAAITCGLGILPPTTPAAEADWRDRLRDTQDKIADVREGIDDASEMVQKATAAVEEARSRLSSARDRLAGVQERVGEATDRAAELTESLAQSREQLTNARAALAAKRLEVTQTRADAADTITSIYEGTGDPGLRALSSFLTAGSLEELEREQQAESLIVGRQAGAYDQVQAAEDRLDETESAVQEATAMVADQKAQAEQVLRDLERLELQAERARDQVLDRVESNRSAREQARKARASDQAALARLREREDTVKQKILAAARAAASAGSGFTGSTGGLLDYPTTGSITSPFGFRIHPIYGYSGLHDGTDFGVACGDPMRAVADGTVISRYYSEVYGNRLYLSLGNINGKNVTAVYNHASDYTYSVGQSVARGATLGYVGDTGWSTGCHLHFTVLENGNAVDPMGYLG